MALSTLEICQMNLLVAYPRWARIRTALDHGLGTKRAFQCTGVNRQRFFDEIGEMRRCGLLSDAELAALSNLPALGRRQEARTEH